MFGVCWSRHLITALGVVYGRGRIQRQTSYLPQVSLSWPMRVDGSHIRTLVVDLFLSSNARKSVWTWTHLYCPNAFVQNQNVVSIEPGTSKMKLPWTNILSKWRWGAHDARHADGSGIPRWDLAKACFVITFTLKRFKSFCLRVYPKGCHEANFVLQSRWSPNGKTLTNEARLYWNGSKAIRNQMPTRCTHRFRFDFLGWKDDDA